MSSHPDNPSVDVAKRRLAKGGLATTIILSSLASKNALATVAYRCTVSGQLSGNLSGPGKNTSSCDVGYSPEDWAARVTGSGATATFTDTSILRQALFTSLGFSDLFNYDTATSTIVPAGTPGTTTATLAKMLKKPAGAGVDATQFDFARAAIATYLNGACITGFPLDAATIVAMFNATVNGTGTYNYVGTLSVTLDRTEVFQYFQFLYTNIAPNPKIA